MTIVVKHSVVTGAPSDPSAIVDGPAWDAAHVVTGLENVQNVDTTNASNITSGLLPVAQMQAGAGTATPLMGGAAAVGTSNKWAHEDHVHPVAGTFQSVTGASATAIDGTSLLAIQRAAPATTTLTLPLLVNQVGRPLSIVDFSTSVTNHAITITPGAGQTIMGQSSWTVYSTADQLGSVTLRPSLDLNSWIIAP